MPMHVKEVKPRAMFRGKDGAGSSFRESQSKASGGRGFGSIQ